MAFTYRLEKGSPLTEQELDDNFRGVANIAQTTADEINKKVTADTNEAKKQANEAAKQALKAKGEADRASQITGLDTVADAIGFAAVPFPDVWIPFNDSLRMLAGFGRDVKVGSDVVATYVNFERATTATYTDKSGTHRTAAINEPRFEKEGLLIEGQSTNLILRSNTHTSVSKFIDTGETTESPLDGDAVRVLAISGGEVANNYIRFNNPVMGSVSTPRTSSCWVKSIGSDISISINCDDVDAVTVTCRADTWTRISATRKTPLSNKYVGFFDISIPNAVGGQKIAVWGAQLEALPFASSYIPTTGAAVTRAADVLLLNGINMPVGAMTFAVNFTCAVNTNSLHGMTIFREDEYSVSNRQTLSVTPAGRLVMHEGDGAIESPSTIISGASQACAAVFSGASSKLALNGVISKTQDKPITSSNKIYQQFWRIGNNTTYQSPIYGHIRNVRIWNSALSDAQIKGLK